MTHFVKEAICTGNLEVAYQKHSSYFWVGNFVSLTRKRSAGLTFLLRDFKWLVFGNTVFGSI